MLAKLNFSNSDKLTFPNSHVRTENCLILLLHMFSQLLGALNFFICGPPGRNANNLRTRCTNCCLLPQGLGCWCVFPGNLFTWSLGPRSCPCDRRQESRLGHNQSHSRLSERGLHATSSPTSSLYKEVNSVPWLRSD